MNQKTLVLGSGITALAYLLYDREAFAVAGDQVGGMFKQTVMGPQYVWVTDSTRQLIRELGLSPQVRRLRVGYSLGGKLYSASDITADRMDEIRKQYSMKTRGVAPEASHMSSGNGNPEVFTIGVSHLVDELIRRVGLRLIPKKAEMVGMYNHLVFFRDGALDYQRLVSTVPAPTLMRLVGAESYIPRFVARDKAYEEFPITNDYLKAGFDYIYFPESEPFHRISAVGGRGPVSVVIREYTLLPGQTAPEAVKRHPAGQIVSGREALEGLPDSVMCLGRYAEWRHDRRLENVLDVIQP